MPHPIQCSQPHAQEDDLAAHLAFLAQLDVQESKSSKEEVVDSSKDVVKSGKEEASDEDLRKEKEETIAANKEQNR